MARWLARQGARVRVADTRQSPPCAAQLARELPDVPSPRARSEPKTSPARTLSPSARASRSSEPAVAHALRSAACRSWAISSCSRRRCRRAGPRQGAGHHRLQRQEHGDRDGWRHVPRGGPAHDRGRQYRPAGAGRAGADRAGTGRGRTPPGSLRAGAVQLPARDHPQPGRRTWRRAEPERGPPGPLPRHGGLRRGQGAHLPRRRASRCSTARTPGRRSMAMAEPPGPDLRPRCAGQRARVGHCSRATAKPGSRRAARSCCRCRSCAWRACTTRRTRWRRWRSPAPSTCPTIRCCRR